VGADLFHEDGRTDVTKIIVALRNLADSPKMCVMNESIASICSFFFEAVYIVIYSPLGTSLPGLELPSEACCQ